MRRAHCIAGRGTTCWKVHHEDDPHAPLVVKDSWQYTERDEEGELVRDATEKGVSHVARYYYHETVQVSGADDDIQRNVRDGLDVVNAKSYQWKKSMPLPRTSTSTITVQYYYRYQK